jgi:hypothetical protein
VAVVGTGDEDHPNTIPKHDVTVVEVVEVTGTQVYDSIEVAY